MANRYVRYIRVIFMLCGYADSGAQVWPYVQLANADPELKEMAGRCYSPSVQMYQYRSVRRMLLMTALFLMVIGLSDLTDMKPELHERKWEIDSLCYPLRLAIITGRTTGDASIFNEEWIQAITNVLKTFKEQQRKDGVGSL